MVDAKGAVALNDDFIDAVRKKLPAQPWPTGTHCTIAEELGESGGQVQKVIKYLISKGEFKNQIDGVVIDSSEELSNSNSPKN